MDETLKQEVSSTINQLKSICSQNPQVVSDAISCIEKLCSRLNAMECAYHDLARCAKSINKKT